MEMVCYDLVWSRGLMCLLYVGLQPVVPSNTTITPPSSNNGSFENCNLSRNLYYCNSHQLFNCSTDTNQYYVWNTFTSIAIADFTNPLQQVKVLMTYFIPDTSGEVILLFTQASVNANGSSEAAPEVPLYTLTTNEGQYNFTLLIPSLISAVNRIIMTLSTGTIAINKIVFCSEPEG